MIEIRIEPQTEKAKTPFAFSVSFLPKYLAIRLEPPIPNRLAKATIIINTGIAIEIAATASALFVFPKNQASVYQPKRIRLSVLA